MKPAYEVLAASMLRMVLEQSGAATNSLAEGNHEVCGSFSNRSSGMAYRLLRDSVPERFTTLKNHINRTKVKRVGIWKFKNVVGILIEIVSTDF